MDLHAPIKQKIESLVAESDAIEISLEESINAQRKASELIQAMLSENKSGDPDFSEYEELAIKGRKADLADEIQLLRDSLQVELFKVDPEAKFIIVDETLVSPAGYHPSALVFKKPSVCIQTDKLPRHLSAGLTAYSVEILKKAVG